MKGSVMVIGGGVAGIRSSLDLADQGYKVHLVEKTPSIGGKMAKLDKTLPTLDCSVCILGPYMVDAGRHENIEIHSYSELSNLEGEPGNFTATIRKKPRGVDVDKCTGCELCSEACPVDVPHEFEEELGERSAIYVPFPQAVPKVAVVDFDACIDCGQCEEACEADAINRDQEEREVELDVGGVILATGFEEYKPKSERSEYNYESPNVVTGLELERLVCATGPTEGEVIRPSDGEHPEKVAILSCVGSRDSKTQEYCSRVCCTFSAKQGILIRQHEPEADVTIFNMDVRPSGKGYQDFINRAQEEFGVNYVRARPLKVMVEDGDPVIRYEDIESGEIFEEEFDLTVLASCFVSPEGQDELLGTLGLSESDVDGFIEEKDRIAAPLETSREGIYLAGVSQGPKDIPDSVSQALGAASKASGLLSEVRGGEAEEKVYPEERDVTGEEPRIGVFICHCGTNIAGTVDVEKVEEEISKVPNVVHVERNLYICSDEGNMQIREAIREEGLNRVVVASCTPRTHEPLFRESCRQEGLNQYLFEMANIRDQCSWVHQEEPEMATEKAIELVEMTVEKVRSLEPLEQERISVEEEGLVIGGGPAGMQAALDIAEQGFPVHLVEKDEELGGKLRDIKSLPDGRSGREILEKLEDNVRSNDLIDLYLGNEVEGVDGHVGDFKVTLSGGDVINVGTITVAIGDEEHPVPEEWESDKTYTQLEFEDYLTDNSEVGSTAFVQCVDQRVEERPQCSAFCCVKSIKQAMRVKEKNPNANVYILYRDIQASGRGHEQLYREAQEAGVKFIRYNVDNTPSLEDGVLRVRDEFLDQEIHLNPDNVVLATGSDPPTSGEELSKMLKVPLDENDYFLESHPKLAPLDTTTEGIYLAGSAQGSKDLATTMSQAAGAALRATVPLARGYVELPAVRVRIDEDACIGCAACEEVCPYEALTVKEVEGKYVSTVEEAECRGCGACVGVCPAGAISQPHFTTEELLNQIRGAFTKEEVKAR